MNHEGLFWVGLIGDRAFLNHNGVRAAAEEVLVAENLTYDEAYALILSMGGEYTGSHTSPYSEYEAFLFGG